MSAYLLSHNIHELFKWELINESEHGYYGYHGNSGLTIDWWAKVYDVFDCDHHYGKTKFQDDMWEYADEYDKAMSQLEKPSLLTKVWLPIKIRRHINEESVSEEIDLTGTTNEEVLEIVRKFYHENKDRVDLGDDYRFTGFVECDDGKVVMMLE